MPDILIMKDIIQAGFAGAFLLMFILLWWTLRASSKERKEFRGVINETQHDQMKCMNNQAKSNLAVARALTKLDKSIDRLIDNGD